MEFLAKHRLVVTGWDETSQQETVEIVHEALIREWGILREWIKSNRRFRIWQERLQVEVVKWKDEKHDEKYLLSGGNLGEAEGWFFDEKYQNYLSGTQRKFIWLSLDAKNRKIKEEKRKQKRTILGFAGFSIVSLFFAGFVGFNWMQSEIRATSSNLSRLATNSKSFFDGGFHNDAFMEAMKASQLLSDTWWEESIPNDIQQEVKATLFNVINDSIFVKNTLEGHRDTVNSVVFSPDGKTIASASRDNTVIIWDAKTGKPIQTLKGHQDTVNSVVFSPDGKTIASASSDKTVKIWDAQTGKPIQTLKGHQYYAVKKRFLASGFYIRTHNIINSVVFSPDGKTIASASLDRTVIIWDVKTGKPIKTLKGHQDDVTSVVFSPDGKTIASASSDKTVKIWDAQTGKPIKILKGHQDDVTSVVYSPEGQTIASASLDKTVKIWDAQTGKPIKILKGHQNGVTSVVFSPDGETIASASRQGRLWHTASWHGPLLDERLWDGTVKIWDAQTGKPIQTLKGHQSRVTSMVFSPDGKTIASASGDNTVKIWDALTGKPIQTLIKHQSRVTSMVFSPDGKTIASASVDKMVKIRDVKTGKPIQTLRHQNFVNSVVFSPDGRTIASASSDKTVKIWDAQTGKPMQTLKGHQNLVNSVVFSSNGKTIASASYRTVIIWDAKSGKLIQTFYNQMPFLTSNYGQRLVTSVVFSPDGKTIAFAFSDNTVKTWDAATGQPIQTFRGHQGAVISVVFSPDGETIVSASWDNTIKIWNAATGKTIHTLKGHRSRVTSVVFSPDGETIVSASWDNTIKIWDALTGKLIQTLKAHQSSVTSVVFSPDGKTIASASRHGTVKLWNWDFEDLVEKGCETFKHHLANNPEKLQQLEICQNEETLTAAASTLIKQGKESVNNGDYKTAVQKFRKAEKWNPKLDINPEEKAKLNQ